MSVPRALEAALAANGIAFACIAVVLLLIHGRHRPPAGLPLKEVRHLLHAGDDPSSDRLALAVWRAGPVDDGPSFLDALRQAAPEVGPTPDLMERIVDAELEARKRRGWRQWRWLDGVLRALIAAAVVLGGAAGVFEARADEPDPPGCCHLRSCCRSVEPPQAEAPLSQAEGQRLNRMKSILTRLGRAAASPTGRRVFAALARLVPPVRAAAYLRRGALVALRGVLPALGGVLLRTGERAAIRTLGRLIDGLLARDMNAVGASPVSGVSIRLGPVQITGIRIVGRARRRDRPERSAEPSSPLPWTP